MRGTTNEVADIESLVVGPESVANGKVPPTVGAHSMVCLPFIVAKALDKEQREER